MPTPLNKLRDVLGVKSDGLSGFTKRALAAHGELPAQLEGTLPTPGSNPEATTAPVVTSPARGGPSPSAALASRVEAQRKATANSSLEAAMASRKATLQKIRAGR